MPSKYTYSDDVLGYYTCGGHKFTSKVLAVEYATANNDHPSWEFNEHVFGKVNWEFEPNEPIDVLYAQRARQLREKYDYLVLNYSAGSDSQNILDTFINNNIKLDEVLVRWFKSATDTEHRLSMSASPSNFASEWELTLYPALKRLAQINPEIKIEFHDTSNDATEFYKNDDWLYSTNGSHLDPCAIFQFDLGYKKYRQLADKGIKTGHIFGIDKPRVIIKDGVFYTYFLDILTGIAHFTMDERVNEFNKPELFYWSPDSVKILQKQTHIVMNFFKLNPGLLSFIHFENLKFPHVRSTYENLIRSMIYPTWRTATFQVGKPTSVFHCEYDDWFLRYYKDKAPLQIWQEGLDYIEKSVDKKFLSFDVSGRLDNFVGFVSPFYKLGTL